jgi:hypothetical protein
MFCDEERLWYFMKLIVLITIFIRQQGLSTTDLKVYNSKQLKRAFAVGE